ncbi:MAG: Fic family protein [Gammaproteobacteria bacterium]|nr:Fic family protein [Gammaproteobacteria bacterium]
MNTLSQTEISRIREAMYRRFDQENIPRMVLKPNLLDSLTDRMMYIYELAQNDEQHRHGKPITYAACKFLFDLVKFHPYVDGNKRTALACFLALLKKNRIMHSLSFEVTEVIQVSTGTMKIAEIPRKIIDIANDQIDMEGFYRYVAARTDE